LPQRAATAVRSLSRTKASYYDREADIVWIPTGSSDDVVSEEMGWGLVDHDVNSDEVVGIEIWAASTRLPADLLARMPPPVEPGSDGT
jgi:uncharacterized protein YuzE